MIVQNGLICDVCNIVVSPNKNKCHVISFIVSDTEWLYMTWAKTMCLGQKLQLLRSSCRVKARFSCPTRDND